MNKKITAFDSLIAEIEFGFEILLNDTEKTNKKNLTKNHLITRIMLQIPN